MLAAARPGISPGGLAQGPCSILQLQQGESSVLWFFGLCVWKIGLGLQPAGM